MLAQNISVNRFTIDIERVRQIRLHSRSIKRRARPEYAIFRQARFLKRHVSQNINRITDNHQIRLRAIRHNVFHNITHNFRINVNQLQSSLTRKLRRTRGNHNDIIVIDIRIISRMNHDISVNSHRVIDVSRLTPSQILITVNQHNLFDDTTQCARISRRRTDHSASANN